MLRRLRVPRHYRHILKIQIAPNQNFGPLTAHILNFVCICPADASLMFFEIAVVVD
jgi:hypothetical protein